MWNWDILPGGSCSETLATHHLDIVSDGCIHLVGPEIYETQEPMLPFAQILVAALEKPGGIDGASRSTLEIENMASAMDYTAHQYAQNDGYMLRSIPSMLWARVSKEAVENGFSLKKLGERLITAIRQRCSPITACEAFFVTSSKKDVDELDDLMEEVRVRRRKLETYILDSEGELECTQEINCEACSEQVVCNTIRDVIRIRKGDRVVTIGQGETTGSESE